MQQPPPVRAESVHPGHLVFDFNGTLLDDNAARLQALNDSLEALGLAPIEMPEYRRTFCVPVPRFYGRLMGRRPTEGEWQLADGVFQRNYLEYARSGARLMKGAEEVLAAWADAGHTQSLLSLHTHEALLVEVERLGIAGYFTLVDGRRGPTGGTKAEAMRRHVAALELRPERVAAIGDTRDDALAAWGAGVSAVLFSGGAQSADDLALVGPPVADSLHGAAEYAGRALGLPPLIPSQRSRSGESSGPPPHGALERGTMPRSSTPW
ncbi:HAD family hydrolase [Streptomyces sp. NPDC046887]|uniref:HAD family hydrolase n=1 Tax=Streptomyces sp. NPDC046887 TaxID=3155472 RepID=UPI0034007247